MRDTSLVLAAVENTYAQPPVITPAQNAMVVFGYNPEPALYDERQRATEKGFPGARKTIPTRGRQRHQFSFELAGSGDAATPASWALWLQAAMFGAPEAAQDEVAYPLIDEGDGGSIAMLGYRGDMKMTPIGMRGNIVFTFEEGDRPYGTCDFMGLLPELPTKEKPGAPTFPDDPGPFEVNSANTAFSVDGFSLLMRSFTLDLGMKTEQRTLVGQNSIIFGSDQSGDRRQIGGRIVAQLPDLDAKNFFEAVPAQQDLSLSLIHGPAGKQVEIASEHLNIKPLSISSEQGRLMMTANYTLVPTAKNNELALFTR